MGNSASKFKLKLDPKMNLEALGDYAYELLEEISRLVAELPESQFISSNKFIDINNKLEKAKSLGVNVKNYEEQIYDFRCSLILGKINEKFLEIETSYKNDIFDKQILEITDISQNYQELEKDFEDISDVSQKYEELTNFILFVKLFRRVHNFMTQGGDSGFDFEQIMSEMMRLKDLGIDVEELEKMCMGE